MPIDHAYVRAILERFEGKAIAQAYVPAKNGVPLGVSGVTIGTGVDLGQQTRSGLLGMGVPPAVVDKLAPYLGLKKNEAQAALQVRPLRLIPAEVDALDAAVIGRYTRDIAARYDRDKPATPFAALPKQAQAVLVSILYQRGPAYPRKAPQLWQALLAGQWIAAAAWLRNPANGGGYHSRRKAEGDILAEIAPGGGYAPPPVHSLIASGGQRAPRPLDSAPGAVPLDPNCWWQGYR